MKNFAHVIAIAAALGALAGQGQSEAIAVTSQFKEKSGRPVSATTVFKESLWKNYDRKNIAHHELTHGVGFTVAYGGFSKRVSTARDYHEDGPGQGTHLAKLTSGGGTHIDPAGGVVNGYQQSKALMQPATQKGIYIGGQEVPMLSAPFWKRYKIDVTVKYVGNWTAVQKAAVEDAVKEAQSHYSGSGNAHSFVWTVQVEAGTSSGVRELPDEGIVTGFRSSDPDEQRMALRSILAMPRDDAEALLREIGAKPMQSVAPPLQDVALSLLLREGGAPFRTAGFGVHLAPWATDKDVVAMGERHGFFLPEGEEVDPEAAPAAYVTLAAGQDLFSVMEAVLTAEEAVTSVNLEHFEE